MRRMSAVVLAFALLLSVLPSALAQDATPATGSPTASPSLLAGLGYPELVITTDGTTSDAPADLPAGRYHLVLVNTSDVLTVDLELYKVPDGMTFDELNAEFQASDPESFEPPPIFYEVTIGGGPSAGPGSTGDIIVDFSPGDWAFNVFAYNDESEEEPPSNMPTQVTVTGELPELTDPAVDVAVNMIEMAFEMPEVVPAGPAIWQVTNSGAFPHFLLIESYPEPVTNEQVEAALAMFLGTPVATPAAMLDPEQLVDVDGTLVLSTGQTNWIEVDLAPGQYIVFCFISGPGDVPIHAAMGMYKILTVE